MDGGKKAISPLIAVSLSACTYECSQIDLIILAGQIVLYCGARSTLWKSARGAVGLDGAITSCHWFVYRKTFCDSVSRRDMICGHD